MRKWKPVNVVRRWSSFETYWWAYNLGKNAAKNTLIKQTREYQVDFKRGYNVGYEQGRKFGLVAAKNEYMDRPWKYLMEYVRRKFK